MTCGKRVRFSPPLIGRRSPRRLRSRSRKVRVGRSGISSVRRIQIAGAPALDSKERGAAITIASAHPEVVQQAFAPEYRSFIRDDDPAARGYHPDLFDRHDGLERFRQEFEGKRSEARPRPADDEGLPF